MLNKRLQIANKRDKIGSYVEGLIIIATIALIVWFYGLFFFYNAWPKRTIDLIGLAGVGAFVLSFVVGIFRQHWQAQLEKEDKIEAADKEKREQVKSQRRKNHVTMTKDEAIHKYGIKPKKETDKHKDNKIVDISGR